MAGLVTIEDILEEIVGEIRDEREAAALPVTALPDGSYLIDRFPPIDTLRDLLGLPLDESRDYTTLAGFLLDRLQAILARGTSLSANGHRMDGRRDGRATNRKGHHRRC